MSMFTHGEINDALARQGEPRRELARVRQELETAHRDLGTAKQILTVLCVKYRAGGFKMWDTVELAEAFLAKAQGATPCEPSSPPSSSPSPS